VSSTVVSVRTIFVIIAATWGRASVSGSTGVITTPVSTAIRSGRFPPSATSVVGPTVVLVLTVRSLLRSSRTLLLTFYTSAVSLSGLFSLLPRPNDFYGCHVFDRGLVVSVDRLLPSVPVYATHLRYTNSFIIIIIIIIIVIRSSHRAPRTWGNMKI